MANTWKCDKNIKCFGFQTFQVKLDTKKALHALPSSWAALHGAVDFVGYLSSLLFDLETLPINGNKYDGVKPSKLKVGCVMIPL